MQNMNVSAMDTRDSKGRGRFFPFVPEQHLFPGKITAGYWYWNNIYYPPKQVVIPLMLYLRKCSFSSVFQTCRVAIAARIVPYPFIT